MTKLEAIRLMAKGIWVPGPDVRWLLEIMDELVGLIGPAVAVCLPVEMKSASASDDIIHDVRIQGWDVLAKAALAKLDEEA